MLKNTCDDLVAISLVKEQYAATQKLSFKHLLSKYEKLGAQKVPQVEFQAATDAIECPVCHTALQYKGDKCSACEKQAREKAAQAARLQEKQRLAQQQEQLVAELNKLVQESAEHLDSPFVCENDMIVRRVGVHRLRIERQQIYSGSSWRQHAVGYALRILTDVYGVKAASLRKDYGAPNLAKGLFQKSQELLKVLLQKDEAAQEAKTLEDTIKISTGDLQAVKVEMKLRQDYKGRYVETAVRKVSFEHEGETIYTLTSDGLNFAINYLPAMSIENVLKVTAYVKSLLEAGK